MCEGEMGGGGGGQHVGCFIFLAYFFPNLPHGGGVYLDCDLPHYQI